MARNKLRVKRDDTVVVIAGKHKGQVGKVVRVLPEEARVVIEGVALVQRHVKPRNDQPGQIVQKEAPIHVSNVALWDAANGKRVKVGYRVESDGTKVRVDRKTGVAV